MSIAPLSADDRDTLQRSFSLAARLAGAVLPLSAAQVQRLYDDLLQEDDGNAEVVAAVGVAFGALLMVGRPYEWVRKSDEWGSELALGVFGLEVSVHPISMIQHRLEDQEEVDIARLVDMTVETVNGVIADNPGLRSSDGE